MIDRDALLVRTLRLRDRPFHLVDFAIAEPALATGPAARMLAVPFADIESLLATGASVASTG